MSSRILLLFMVCLFSQATEDTTKKDTMNKMPKALKGTIIVSTALGLLNPTTAPVVFGGIVVPVAAKKAYDWYNQDNQSKNK